MNKIVLNDTLYKDWEDEKNCFGTYLEGDPSCEECKDGELCKKIAKADDSVKVINSAIADAAEVFCDDGDEESAEESSVKSVEAKEYTRDSLVEAIKVFSKDNNLNWKIKSIKTRDKVYDEDTQIFTITNKTIKFITEIPPIEFGLSKEDYNTEYNGFKIELEKGNEIDFAFEKSLKIKNSDSSIDEEEPGTQKEMDLEDELDENSDGNENSNESDFVKITTKAEEKLEELKEKVKGSEEKLEKRQLVGGISIQVYSDDTVQISTTITKERFDKDAILEKFSSLLETFLN